MNFIQRALCSGLIASAFSLTAHAAAPAKPAKAPALTPDQVEAIVHDYLLKNPGILREASMLLQRQDLEQAQKQASAAVEMMSSDLLSVSSSPVGGNPAGDVTVVEFFDYHCGYCKRVAPAIKELLASDPKVRLIYKQLPILGPDSIVAARAALAANRQGKYQDFHDALFAADSLAEPAIMALAAQHGLDVERLRADMNDAQINAELEKNVAMSSPLGINGTPGFVVGNTVAPGALDLEGLRQMVAKVRKEQQHQASLSQ
ncbi:thioredoxin domain-containing protein [Pseudoduganella sp. FT25W]|uniref:Thioredoxin domain-containing protein n=1 Tax=Duganella alba TaxID=2666081 RepID=A0A6L5QEI7_9BURK|nr:DsbA family protein [Duganella alba]MRX08154.1 thioredoxin domain-containing protein [Duganella alba]MRX16309.1 thioredoxin domain-containing protein [Duganella alba]